MLFTLLALFLAGCGQQPESPRGAVFEKSTSSTDDAKSVVQESATNTVTIPAGYPSTPEQTALKKTFVKYFANPNYASDGNNLYINPQDAGSGWSENYQIVKNVDLKTFELIDGAQGILFKDKNTLYININKAYSLKDSLRAITNADKDTVVAVSAYCIKDKNRVYCDDVSLKKERQVAMHIVNDADPATFEKITEQENYFKDKNNIFCNQGDRGMIVEKLEGADVNTFSIVPRSTEYFAKDKNNVFRLCDKLDGADPATFQILDNATYQKDKNSVYDEGWKMPGADPASFVIFNLFLTKDKNAVYQNGQKIDKIKDPASFVAQDYTNGQDKYNHYEIIRWGDKRGLVVTIKPLK